MTWLDISTYFQMYITGSFMLCFIGSCLVSLMIMLFLGSSTDMSPAEYFEQPKVLRTLIILITTLTLLSTIVGSLPTHDRIFELKISKMKNELVTKDNVNKGLDHIERIAEKLECKYLGCNKRKASE